ncbi:MAG: hypothetical protein NT080_09765 [Spirochaetes bacterium]|nr:hypothetical protein [Spirochaetota bacterium]
MTKNPLIAFVLAFACAAAAMAQAAKVPKPVELGQEAFAKMDAGDPAGILKRIRRPSGSYEIVGSREFYDLPNNVILREDCIQLTEDQKPFLEQYRQHLGKAMGTVCEFLFDKRVTDRFDDSFFYAYTFQEPWKGEMRLNADYAALVMAQRHFPRAIEFTFWPWTDAGKVNGLYMDTGSTSSGGVIQLSLYDTFEQDAILKAVKKQDPGWKYGDSYGSVIKSMQDAGIAERMPIVQVFLHEGTHAVLQFARGGGFAEDDRRLYEGVTELLALRAAHWFSAGYEDFIDVFAYPGGVFMAGLLFSIDPQGLLDWYTRARSDPDAAFADSIAAKLSAIRDVRGNTPALDPTRTAAFKDAFRKVYTDGGATKREQLCAVFADYCDLKILWEWVRENGTYFNQLPLKLRLFVVTNFFGLDAFRVGPDPKQYELQVRDMLSKAERKNWNNKIEKEIEGFLKDPSGEEQDASPIGIQVSQPKKDADEPDDMMKNKKPQVLDANTGVMEGPDKSKWKKDRIKAFVPDKAEQPRSSLPSVKAWFDEYWKKNGKPSDAEYVKRRDGLIVTFDLTRVDAITDFVIATTLSKKAAQEWLDFLNGYIAPNLSMGKDSLRIPQVRMKTLYN